MSPSVDAVPSNEALPTSADVVVVGGGIVGVSAAYFLAKKGVSVAVVEKGVVGCEQSSRNWGFVRQQGRDKAELPIIKESLSIWAGLKAEIGIDVGYRRTGLLYLTEKPSDLSGWESWLEHAREYQIQSKILSASETQKMVPSSPRKWIAGLYTPHDGHAEPSLAAPAIAVAAQRLGATVHQYCAARGLETASGRISAVVTERGAIATSAVLCAGGAWSGLFCRRHGIDLPQLSARASVLRTSPLPEVADCNISTSGFSLRRRLDGGYNVAIGGRWIFDIVPDAFRYMRPFWPAFIQQKGNMTLHFGRSFFDALRTPRNWSLDEGSPFERVRAWDPTPDPRILNDAYRNFMAAFPNLENVHISESWGGMIDITPDAVPVISDVSALPGFYLATGFSGHGFGIAPGAGRLASELITGTAPTLDPLPFRYDRLGASRIAEETVPI